MTSIMIRRLDDSVKARLRIRAAKHGRSMEEEVREILKATLAGEEAPQPDLAESIRNRIDPLGGVNLPEIDREPMREPPRLGR